MSTRSDRSFHSLKPAGVGAVIALLVGCAEPTSIEIGEKPTELSEGDTIQLRVAVLDQDGKLMTEQKPVISSSAPTVVSASGEKLEAIGAGTATVTATLGGLRDSFRVTVLPTITKVEVECPENPCEMFVGTQITLAASAFTREKRRSGLAFGWKSSSPDIAAIDGSGLVSGVKPGKARIVADTLGTEGGLWLTVKTKPKPKPRSRQRTRSRGAAGTSGSVESRIRCLKVQCIDCASTRGLMTYGGDRNRCLSVFRSCMRRCGCNNTYGNSLYEVCK